MPTPDPTPETPEELAGPRYALGEQFSRGGMGGLWYARESATGRTIALKRILGRPDADSFRRFLNEARITARLEHPNIVPVHGLGTDGDGHPFYTMKLVQGTDLGAVLKKLAGGDQETIARYPLAQLLIIFQKVCDAVAFAHSRNVIHRDLKPANIMLGPFGEVLVMDWGLAKDLGQTKAGLPGNPPGESIASPGSLPGDDCVTAAESDASAGEDRGTVVKSESLKDNPVKPAEPEESLGGAGGTLPGQAFGSPHYMAPEQARGDIHLHDARTDIYSLGAVLYQILALRRPVSGTTMHAIIARVIEGNLDPLLLPRRDAAADEDADLPAELRRPKIARLELRHLPESVIPESLAAVVLRAMAFEPERRYQSVPELQREITAYQNGFATGAERAGLGKQILLALRRNRREATVAAAALLLLLILAGASFLRIRRERDLADEQRQRAEAAATQARENLSQSDFLQALRSIDEDKARDALAQLTRSLSVNPRNDAALYRLTTLLTYHSFALPVSGLKHDDMLNSARFSPDGKRIVTASGFPKAGPGAARVWDAQSGKPLTEPLKHDRAVESAQFSPDGTRIVTASRDQTARVWDAQSGKPLTKPMKHDGYVVSAQFSPDGKQIATASDDNTARVWDAQSGKPLTEPMKHNGYVVSAQFSPDGTRIVTASKDETARVWDAQSGKPLTDPLKHDREVESARFSPDGTRIVTVSGNVARVWDAQSGKPVTEPMEHDDQIHSAQIIPDGTRIVTVSGNVARVWDAQSGKLLTESMKHDDQVQSAQISPDGKQIVTASDDNTTRVWDAQTGKPVTEPIKHNRYVVSAQFSPNGKRIVTASWDNTARVLDVQSGQPLTEPLHGGNSAQFSPDGKRIVTASDNEARVWDAQSGRPVTERMKHDDQIHSAQFSPDGEQIVTASGLPKGGLGTARVWDARSGRPVTAPMKHNDNVGSVQFSPDGKRIVTASGNAARIWDAQSGKPLTESTEHDDWVHSAQFSLDGKRIVTALAHHTARVWDAQSGKPLTAPMKRESQVYSAQFSPDGNRIVTASKDGTALVWDAQSGKPLTAPMEHEEVVWSAQFSPDGKRIATASWDKTARVWDAQSGRPLTDPMKHNDFVDWAQFSPDGKRIVTASKDGAARIWDAQSGKPLTEPMKHNGFVDSVQFSPDGKRIETPSIRGFRSVAAAQFSPDGKQIVTASDNGTAQVWDVSPRGHAPEWLPRLAEAVAGQHLNDRSVFEPLSEDHGRVLEEIRAQLSRSPAHDDWTIWGRWFLADRSTRTISPFSKITVPEYIENRIKENTPASLDEAERLAIGSAEILNRIANARAQLDKQPAPAPTRP